MLGYMGCDVTTFGNHEFDYRSKGLANMPVSYTHLDVYKRQLSERLRAVDENGRPFGTALIVIVRVLAAFVK